MSTAQWAVDRMIANAGKVSFTIPSCIESGQYLLRHEIIGASSSPCLVSLYGGLTLKLSLALHAAESYPGAQFYMECAQINVVGGTGAKTPANTVSFPGAYKVSTSLLG